MSCCPLSHNSVCHGRFLFIGPNFACAPIKSLPHNSDLRTLRKKLFENIAKNIGNQLFLLFPTMSTTLPNVTFIYFSIPISCVCPARVAQW